MLFALLTAVYNGTLYGRPAPWALLAGMLGYGCANTAFAGLSLLLISRRELGILKRIRSTPLPTAAYLTALVVALIVLVERHGAGLLALRDLPQRLPGSGHLASVALLLALPRAAVAGRG